MRQAPVPPGRECSTSQASEPEKRGMARIISLEEQESLEHAHFFDAFCAWLYRLAQEERARRETDLPTSAV